MKTNFKYVTLMAAALMLGFSSCSNDEDAANGIANAGKTTAKVTLIQASPSTYSLASAGVPTAEEKVIKSAKLYIFNAVQILESIVSLEATDVTDGGAVASKTFETTAGAHYVYAVVNAPTLPATIVENGISLSAFEKEMLNVADEEALTGLITGEAGFFMTNVARPAATYFEAGGTIEAPKTISVVQIGRAVAKVNVVFSATAAMENGTFTAVQYKVRNNPNKMHLMPVIENGVLKTPYFADAYEAGSASKYFNATAAFIPAGTASYAMENSNISKVRNGKATNVLIKGKYTPVKVYNPDGSVGDAAADGTFYCVQGSDGRAYNATPDAAILGSNTLLTYSEGISRYRLNLADNDQSDEVAKYTVKRNSYFYVTIVSISGPGMDDNGNTMESGNGTTPDPDPNPEDPNDPISTETNIKATISVLDWTVIDQTGGI